MIPRTVLMAQEVASQFTAAQVEEYGNIILNGYLSVIPNTVNKKAWQYKETTTAPVNLPSLTEVQPMYRGWTTNYMQYYTQLPPNAYSQDPGNPTMFEYLVDHWAASTGPITAISNLQGGQGYPPGSYAGVAAVSPTGSGATLDLTVDATGTVTSATLNAAGTGYSVNQGLTVTLGTGSGFSVFVSTITPTTPEGQPEWAQPPRRFYQNQVSPSSPNPSINNPQAIAYTFMYPVADNPTPPPIDSL